MSLHWLLEDILRVLVLPLPHFLLHFFLLASIVGRLTDRVWIWSSLTNRFYTVVIDYHFSIALAITLRLAIACVFTVHLAMAYTLKR